MHGPDRQNDFNRLHKVELNCGSSSSSSSKKKGERVQAHGCKDFREKVSYDSQAVVIKTGGYKTNLYYCHIIQQTHVFLCSVTLRIFKEKFETLIQNGKNIFSNFATL